MIVGIKSTCRCNLHVFTDLDCTFVGRELAAWLYRRSRTDYQTSAVTQLYYGIFVNGDLIANDRRFLRTTPEYRDTVAQENMLSKRELVKMEICPWRDISSRRQCCQPVT